MYLKIFNSITVLFLMLISMPLLAKEMVDMEGMSVIGNKESPNLLYIVPWKSPEMPEMAELELLPRLFNDALMQVDRRVLTRKGFYWHEKQKINNRLK